MNSSVEAAIKPYAEYVQKQPRYTGPKPGSKKLTAPEQEIMKEAGKAIKTWLASNEGKTKMRSMQSMSLLEISNEAAALLNNPVFQKTVQLIQDHPKLAAALRSFPIHSVSIGFTFEAEIVIGVSGSVGYAVNPTDLLGVSSSFLSLSAKEGAEVGAFGGIQFGIWESAPDDMNGVSFGAEITFDPEIIGLSAGISRGTSSDSWGATVTGVAGEDAGIEFQEAYTFLLTEADLGLKPVYQFPASHFLILDKLTCENTKEVGKDEVYLRFVIDGNREYRFPSWDYRSMGTDKDNNEWYIGRSVWFNSKVEVTLYDDEDGGGDDKMRPSDKDHSFKFDFSDFKNDKHITKTMDYTSTFDEVKYKLSAKLIK
jgi:hypothetical protein